MKYTKIEFRNMWDVRNVTCSR